MTEHDLSRLPFQQVIATERVLPRGHKTRHALCVAVGDSQVREAIEDRRADLGMSQDDLARAADISMSTLQRVLRGHEPLAKTARAIERALDWEKGALQEVAAGREPRLLAAPAGEVDDDEMSIEELRETVDGLTATVEKLRAHLARLETQRDRANAPRSSRAIR
jgi:transcriptional regulator with XRE-family HTH domain